jgi:hypothetical protein
MNARTRVLKSSLRTMSTSLLRATSSVSAPICFSNASMRANCDRTWHYTRTNTRAHLLNILLNGLNTRHQSSGLVLILVQQVPVSRSARCRQTEQKAQGGADDGGPFLVNDFCRLHAAQRLRLHFCGPCCAPGPCLSECAAKDSVVMAEHANVD